VRRLRKKLPAGSMLVLPDDVSDPDLDRIQGLGFDARRNSDAEAREFEERRAAIEAAHAELEEVTERLTRVLRQRHPQLFDSDGNMREDEYARMMLARTGGRKYLSREDIIALEEGRPLPSDEQSPIDAP